MYFLRRCGNGYNLSLRPDISLMGKGREQRETERKEGRGKIKGKGHKQLSQIRTY
jgi:hypothetical protein